MYVLRKRGFEATELSDICRRAGVEVTDVPEPMRDKRRLLLAVSEAYADSLQADVGAAFDSVPDWPANLRAAAYEMVRWTARHPEGAWWGTIGVLDAGEAARARRDEIAAWAARMIDAGRAVAADPAAVPEHASTLAVGAIVETLGRIMQGGIGGEPLDDLRWLMYAAVRPYLGEEAARSELRIPPPVDLLASRGPATSPDPGF
jgi:AcrR family transcriptional regulator